MCVCLETDKSVIERAGEREEEKKDEEAETNYF